MLLIGAVAYWLALASEVSLVQLLLASYGIISQFAPTVVAALYWRRANTLGALAGLLAGTLTSVFFWRYPELRPLDMHEGVLGLLVHVPVLIAVTLMTPAQEKAHVRGFFP